jgi:ER membrane protein SH3
MIIVFTKRFHADIQANFISLPPFTPTFPSFLRTPTLELASSHLVCSVALTGILALQAGRWWAENNDSDDNGDTQETHRVANEKGSGIPQASAT